MTKPPVTHGCAAFGFRDSLYINGSNLSSSEVYVADAVLPSTPFGKIRTGSRVENERIHAGLPWPPEARIKKGQPLRRAPMPYVWRAFVEAGDQTARWRSDIGISFPLERIIAAHIEGNLNEGARHFDSERGDKVIIAIPNNLDEHGQETLIRELNKLGIKRENVHLIWRPVAAALTWLKKIGKFLPETINNDDHVHLIYLGPDAIEFNTLRLRTRQFENKQYYLPLRDRPLEILPLTGFDWVGRTIETVYGPIDDGAFWQAFTGFPEIWCALSGIAWNTDELPRVWGTEDKWLLWDPPENMSDFLEKPLAGPCKTLSAITQFSCNLKVNSQGASSKKMSEILQEETRNLISNHPKGKTMGMIVFGPLAPSMPPKWLESSLAHLQDRGLELRETVGQPKLHGLWLCGNCNDPIAEGAAIYGKRVGQEEPTYLDTLPSYGIWSEIKNLGSEPYWDFYPLIPENTEIEGGSEFVLDPPVDKLFIKKGSKEFPLIIKHGISEKCRESQIKLPRNISDNCRVLVHARMKPASGLAIVNIRSSDDKAVFKTGKGINLDWDRMKEVEHPPKPPGKSSYGYPFVSAGNGRIISETETEKKLQAFLADLSTDQVLNVNQIQYLNNKNAEFFIPWGWNRFDQDSYDIGMFGPCETDVPRINEISARLGEILYQSFMAVPNRRLKEKLCKLLGFMYSYAPQEFCSYLASTFSENQISFQNQVIAAGRVFKDPRHFEIFVDSIISYPEYPTNYKGWYFWSFMRALCYYPQPARLNADKGYAVYERFYRYLDENRHNHLEENNAKRYCLCAVLFGLRLRETNPDFLGENDPLRKKLYQVINTMRSKIRFPPVMFRGGNLQTIPGDNLNRYVLRFLDYKDTEEDRQAAGGLAAGG